MMFAVNRYAAEAEKAGLAPIWDQHIHLLDQTLDLISRLEGCTHASYAFGNRFGPHVRHILDHYTALLDGLVQRSRGASACVEYDARTRDRSVETNPAAAQSRIETTQRALAGAKNAFPHDVEMPLSARFTTGALGEGSLTVMTSLGRELLFLESHTIHHLALLADCARGLGVNMGPDFGKAPATIAHERRMSANGH